MDLRIENNEKNPVFQVSYVKGLNYRKINAKKRYQPKNIYLKKNLGIFYVVFLYNK